MKFLSLPVIAALLLGSASAATAAGPTPVEELLRHVPEDVSFCLVIRDLRGHWARLAESPLMQKLEKSPLYPALKNIPELEQLRQLERLLTKNLDLDFKTLRDEILGDALVLAFRQGQAGQQSEEGLILVRARRAERLAELVNKFNQMQKDSGRLKELQERQHEGVKYQRRVEARETSYYAIKGPVFLYSGQESILKQSLALDRRTPSDAESALGKRLRPLGLEKSLATLWINPRAFDRELKAKAESTKGAEAAFLKLFGDCWKHLGDLVLSLKVDADLELSLSARGDAEKMPAPVRKLLRELGSPSELWARFPEDALLAAALRVSPATLWELLSAVQPKETIDTLKAELDRHVGALVGKKVVEELFPHIGPDWGLCVLAPPSTETGWMPQVILAVKVREGEREAPADKALLTALEFYARAAVLEQNKTRKADLLSLKTLKQDGLEVRYVASQSGAAMGLQPAFTLCDGYLILASSPQAVRAFAGAKPRDRKEYQETPLLRLSVKSLRRYLSERRQAVIAALAEQNKATVKETGEKLDGLLAVLEFLDRVELVQSSSAKQAMLTLRIKPSWPLKK